MSVEIIVRETKTGLEIVSGRRRLDALLALRDEVVVMSPGVGEVVIARLPDGRRRHARAARQRRQGRQSLGARPCDRDGPHEIAEFYFRKPHQFEECP